MLNKESHYFALYERRRVYHRVVSVNETPIGIFLIRKIIFNFYFKQVILLFRACSFILAHKMLLLIKTNFQKVL